MFILGIETSCDDTGIGIYHSTSGLVAHTLYSQTKLHEQFGGTVPELASREHANRINALIQLTLNKGNISKHEINGIAYTKGPGLAGSLLVGASTAKAMGYALDIPTLGIHHLEGHILAALLDNPTLEYPFLSLLISGGHTLLIQAKALGQYEILGQSIDDAAGEAFDKTARLMGFSHPGGPALEQKAKSGNSIYKLPRPMCDRPGFDFSFSGLKTFTKNTYNKTQQTEQDKADIAKCFQEAVADVLLFKLKKALEQSSYKDVVVAGGVSANLHIRSVLNTLEHTGINLHYPKLELCTDNGAMIAYAGFKRMQLGQHDTDLSIDVKPRWPLSDLS